MNSEPEVSPPTETEADRTVLTDNDAPAMETKEEERVYITQWREEEKRNPRHGAGEKSPRTRKPDESGIQFDHSDDEDAFTGGYLIDRRGLDVNVNANGDWNDNAGFELEKKSSLDVRLFNANLNECVLRLSDARYQELRADYPVDDLVSVISLVSANIQAYREHTQHTQQQLTALRSVMKTVRENLHLSITRQAMDLSAAEAEEEKTDEELALQARLAKLNLAIAQVHQDVTEATRLAVETEEFSIKSHILAEQARLETERIQEELLLKAEMERQQQEEEERKREEAEKRKVEEERKLVEERLAKEELLKKKEEMRTGYRSQEEKEALEAWPHLIFNSTGAFVPDSSDAGEVMCVLRGNPHNFKQSDVRCRYIEQSEVHLTYSDQDELISKIIVLEGSQMDQLNLVEPIFVAIAYTIRLPSSREAIVLAKTEHSWQALVTNDVQFEGIKDYKFAQARLEKFTTLAVMSRFKREYLLTYPSKKPVKLASAYDQRVTITIPGGLFKEKEDLMLQVQPVDSGTLSEIRATGEHRNKSLLASSPILHTEWHTQKFKPAITITLPCPPNPAKAKKMALVKKQKEEKLKTPVKHQPPPEEKPKTPKVKALQGTPSNEDVGLAAAQQQPTRWYMGQYGQTDDDENDKLCLIGFLGGKCMYVHDVEVFSPKIDMVSFDIEQAYERCLVLRVRSDTEDEHLKLIAHDLIQQLAHRPIKVMVKQRNGDPYDVCVQVVPAGVVERVERMLREEQYTIGPDKYPGGNIKEGETITVQLRGNLKFKDKDPETDTINVIFNSNLTNKLNFYVREADRYLQKSFDSFRGAVRVTRQFYVMPPKVNVRAGEVPPAPILKTLNICDVDVDIPKSHILADPIPIRVPVTLHDCGFVDETLLRSLAEDLGDEWTRLASRLNIDNVRLQSIMRPVNAREQDDDRAKFEMLMTWLKRCPQAADKVALLGMALENISRHDLAMLVKTGKYPVNQSNASAQPADASVKKILKRSNTRKKSAASSS